MSYPYTQAQIQPLPLGTIIAYQEFTSAVTISGTTAAAATTIVTAPTFVADGVTPYWIEFFAPVSTPAVTDFIIYELYESASDLGQNMSQNGTSTTAIGIPVYARRKLTPAAGVRQYIQKAFRNATNGTVTAGVGSGTGTYMPGYIMITKAG